MFSLAGLVLLLATAAALAASGALTQPAGTAGCISEDGSGPCADGYALMRPSSVAVSPDGKNVYVASYISNAVVRLNRNTTTGAITQPNVIGAGCVSEDGTGGLCADGHSLKGPSSVAVSPDGKNVYVASYINPGAVARFNRNTTTGAITQPAGTAGCISAALSRDLAHTKNSSLSLMSTSIPVVPAVSRGSKRYAPLSASVFALPITRDYARLPGIRAGRTAFCPT